MYDDNKIILDTDKNKFIINVKKGISTIPIINSSSEYLGLIGLKEKINVKIKHQKNICEQIIIRTEYNFISSEDDSEINLTDTE
tara:strand:+ start:145 stop:396 length:252 start_codon:yes stop_codon:yes gene_type:complete